MLGMRSNHGTLSKKRPLRVIAIITLWSFLFSSIGSGISLQEAWAARTPLGLSHTGSNRPGSLMAIDVNTFTLPLSLGQIKDLHNANTNKLVIHIQDAHCNYAAQHKISDLIQYFNDQYGISSVNLEGGSGAYDLSIFTGIQDAAVRDKVTDYFVKEGLVNGAEYYAIRSPGKINLWGIENAKTYIQNLNVYRESLINKEAIDNHLKALTYIIGNLKRHIYTQELQEFDEKYEQYKSEDLDFKDYLTYLLSTANNKNISISNFENIKLLNQALAQEESIDFRSANSERNEIIKRLQGRLSKNELEDLVIKSLAFKNEDITQTDFYSYLIATAKSINLGLEDFPHLQRYIAYISTYNNIDNFKLMDEISQLEDKLKDTMSKNENQRELVLLSKNLALIKNLFNISLTKSDYKYFKENAHLFDMANYVNFIDKHAPLYSINATLPKDVTQLDIWRQELVKFYEYSFKRDNAFLSNLKYDNGKSQTAVVVTGGFHTENLCQLFKENDISYISIMPNFKNGDNYESPYFGLLSGQDGTITTSLLGEVSALALYSDFCRNADQIYGNDLVMARRMWLRLVIALFEQKESIQLGHRFYSFEQEESMEPVEGVVIDGKQVYAKNVEDNIFEENGAAIRMSGENLTKAEHDALNQAIRELIDPASHRMGTFEGLTLYAIPGLIERYKQILMERCGYTAEEAEQAADIVAHAGHRRGNIYMDQAVYNRLEGHPNALDNIAKHEREHIDFYRTNGRYAREEELAETEAAKEQVIALLSSPITASLAQKIEIARTILGKSDLSGGFKPQPFKPPFIPGLDDTPEGKFRRDNDIPWWIPVVEVGPGKFMVPAWAQEMLAEYRYRQANDLPWWIILERGPNGEFIIPAWQLEQLKMYRYRQNHNIPWWIPIEYVSEGQLGVSNEYKDWIREYHYRQNNDIPWWIILERGPNGEFIIPAWQLEQLKMYRYRQDHNIPWWIPIEYVSEGQLGVSREFREELAKYRFRVKNNIPLNIPLVRLSNGNYDVAPYFKDILKKYFAEIGIRLNLNTLGLDIIPDINLVPETSPQVAEATAPADASDSIKSQQLKPSADVIKTTEADRKVAKELADAHPDALDRTFVPDSLDAFHTQTIYHDVEVSEFFRRKDISIFDVQGFNILQLAKQILQAQKIVAAATKAARSAKTQKDLETLDEALDYALEAEKQGLIDQYVRANLEIAIRNARTKIKATAEPQVDETAARELADNHSEELENTNVPDSVEGFYTQTLYWSREISEFFRRKGIPLTSEEGLRILQRAKQIMQLRQLVDAATKAARRAKTAEDLEALNAALDKALEAEQEGLISQYDRANLQIAIDNARRGIGKKAVSLEAKDKKAGLAETAKEKLQELKNALVRAKAKLAQLLKAATPTARRKIVIQGDVHGELDGLKENLRAAGLIDADGNWIGQDAVFVQMGDVIDRGPQSREAYEYLSKLQKQAREQGGDVVRLLGNHELMLLQGYGDLLKAQDDLKQLLAELESATDPEERADIKRRIENIELVMRKFSAPRYLMDILMKEGLSLEEAISEAIKLADKIKQDLENGDVVGAHFAEGRMFIHGGLRSKIREQLKEEVANRLGIPKSQVTETQIAERINEIVKEAVEKKNFSHAIFGIAKGIRRGNAEVGGIFWADYNEELLRSQGAREMLQIVGHTPGGGIRASDSVSKIVVDAGLAEKYGGNRAFLVMEEGKIKAFEKKNGTYAERILGEYDVAEDITDRGEIEAAQQQIGDLEEQIAEVESNIEGSDSEENGAAIRMSGENLNKTEHDALNQAIQELIDPANHRVGTFEGLTLFAIPGLMERYKQILIQKYGYTPLEAQEAADIVAHAGHRRGNIYMDQAVYSQLENQPNALSNIARHEREHVDFYRTNGRYAREDELAETEMAKGEVMALLGRMTMGGKLGRKWRLIHRIKQVFLHMVSKEQKRSYQKTVQDEADETLARELMKDEREVVSEDEALKELLKRSSIKDLVDRLGIDNVIALIAFAAAIREKSIYNLKYNVFNFQIEPSLIEKALGQFVTPEERDKRAREAAIGMTILNLRAAALKAKSLIANLEQIKELIDNDLITLDQLKEVIGLTGGDIEAACDILSQLSDAIKRDGIESLTELTKVNKKYYIKKMYRTNDIGFLAEYKDILNKHGSKAVILLARVIGGYGNAESALQLIREHNNIVEKFGIEFLCAIIEEMKFAKQTSDNFYLVTGGSAVFGQVKEELSSFLKGLNEKATTLQDLERLQGEDHTIAQALGYMALFKQYGLDFLITASASENLHAVIAHIADLRPVVDRIGLEPFKKLCEKYPRALLRLLYMDAEMWAEFLAQQSRIGEHEIRLTELHIKNFPVVLPDLDSNNGKKVELLLQLLNFERQDRTLNLAEEFLLSKLRMSDATKERLGKYLQKEKNDVKRTVMVRGILFLWNLSALPAMTEYEETEMTIAESIIRNESDKTLAQALNFLSTAASLFKKGILTREDLIAAAELGAFTTAIVPKIRDKIQYVFGIRFERTHPDAEEALTDVDFIIDLFNFQEKYSQKSQQAYRVLQNIIKAFFEDGREGMIRYKSQESPTHPLVAQQAPQKVRERMGDLSRLTATAKSSEEAGPTLFEQLFVTGFENYDRHCNDYKFNPRDVQAATPADIAKVTSELQALASQTQDVQLQEAIRTGNEAALKALKVSRKDERLRSRAIGVIKRLQAMQEENSVEAALTILEEIRKAGEQKARLEQHNVITQLAQAHSERISKIIAALRVIHRQLQDKNKPEAIIIGDMIGILKSLQEFTMQEERAPPVREVTAEVSFDLKDTLKIGRYGPSTEGNCQNSNSPDVSLSQSLMSFIGDAHELIIILRDANKRMIGFVLLHGVWLKNGEFAYVKERVYTNDNSLSGLQEEAALQMSRQIGALLGVPVLSHFNAENKETHELDVPESYVSRYLDSLGGTTAQWKTPKTIEAAIIPGEAPIQPGLGGTATEAEFHEGGVNNVQSEALIGQIEPFIDSLEISTVGPQVLSFDVNDETLTVSIEVDNSMPHMFEISQNGKVLKINLSLIQERFGAVADTAIMAKAIILHELADALGMQLGYNHNTRHTASLTIEGLLAQRSPEIRNMLVPLWQARPVAFGAGDVAGTKAVAETQIDAAKGVITDLRQGTTDIIVMPGSDLYKGQQFAVGKQTERKLRRDYGQNTVPLHYVHSDGVRGESFMEVLKSARDRLIEAKEKNDLTARALINVPHGEREYVLKQILNSDGFKEVKDRFSIVELEDIPANGIIDEVMHIILGKGLLNYERYRQGDYGAAELDREAKLRLANLIRTLVSNPQAIDFDNDPDIINKLLEGIIALRIKPIDFKEIQDWKDAQDEALRAV